MKTLTAVQVASLVPVVLTSLTRKGYYSQQVVDINGQVVQEADWKKLVPTDMTGRKLTFQLKKQGLKKSWTFNEAEYELAKKNLTQLKATQRFTLISEAFNQAAAPKEHHVEKALQDLLPLFKNVPLKKTLIVFRNIIANVADAQQQVLRRSHHELHA